MTPLNSGFRRLLLLLLLPLSLSAGTKGTDLKGYCNELASNSGSHLHSGVSFCEGYIRGISEANNGMGFCRRTAAERSPGFEREAIQRFLANHSERLQEPAHQLVLDALRQDFPCL